MTHTNPRRALVTGGSGDIGGAICRALAAQGAHVIVHANGNLARAEAVCDEILASGGSAEAVAFMSPTARPRSSTASASSIGAPCSPRGRRR
jgi:NAD(P)-dependent dehydrogenase (short-subunit alcohol dehydrogenase family)